VRSTLEYRQPAPPRPSLEPRRILCAFDLSAASRPALAAGLRLAGQLGAQARVLHVGRPVDTPSQTAALPAAIERACQDLRGGSPEVVVVPGDPVHGILEQAGAWPADLIVMGTHGESSQPSWSLGSITNAVVRRAAAAVLAVPPDGDEAGTTAPPFRRVLAAFDFSGPGRRMLDRVAGILHSSEAEVTLLHVLEWFPAEGEGASPSFQVSECQLDLAEVTVARLSQALRDSALAALPYHAEVAAGIPHREILRVAAERRADLIALGLHHRRALDQWLPGSTVSHLLRESRCPILAVKLG
jgi:nucleotide-binding universal stress UspA family protein